jgi:CBS domain-containing protein
MRVADILRIKGSTVKTVTPDETALELSEKLRAAQIGAMIVSEDGTSIDGIISERDLAYGLASHGRELPRIAVSKLMTKVVLVCSPEDSITDVMKLMTQRRIRHLPVKDGAQLVGIISIGDVLKHRLGEVQLEANVLRDYAMAARRQRHHAASTEAAIFGFRSRLARSCKSVLPCLAPSRRRNAKSRSPLRDA